jgi:hypothetical protein
LKAEGRNEMSIEGRVEVGKIYRHYKGNEYLVLCIAKHSETLEDMVIYKAQYGEGTVWARPLPMFLEKIEVNGVIVSRFQKI